MKQKILPGLIFPLILCAGTTRFDQGGTSFMMEKVQERRVSSNEKRENFLKNGDFTQPPAARPGHGGWFPHNWISGQGEIKQKEAAARIFGKIQIKDGMLEIRRTVELEKSLGKDTPRFCNTATQFVKLPETAGTGYQIEFEYRNLRSGQYPSYCYVVMTYYDAASPDLKLCRRLGYKTLKLEPSSSRRKFSREVNVPPGTRNISIAFRGDGAGILQIWHTVFAKKVSTHPLAVEYFPGSFLDNRCVLATGAPGLLGFRLKNNLPGEKWNVPAANLHLELPAEIRVIGTNCHLDAAIHFQEFNKNGQAWRRYTLPLHNNFLAMLGKTNGPQNWNIPMVMIESSSPPGKSWNDCRFYISAFNRMVSGPGSLKIQAGKKLPEAQTGKLFLSGLVSCADDMNFHQIDARNKLASLWGRSGINFVVMKTAPDFIRCLHQAGIKYVTMQSSQIANGYRIGGFSADRKAPESCFYDKNGKIVSDRSGSAATCPHAVYSRSQYFTERVVPIIKELIPSGISGFSPNWEPYMFLNSGCFCANCMKDFAAFAKLPPEKVKTFWPEQLQIGFPYRDTAIRFRAWQHGRLVKTLHREVLAAGGKEIGFAPMVGTDQLICYPDSFYEQYEFSPYEYADALSHLFVWGPYQWFNGEEPFVYTKGLYLRQFAYASAVMRDYGKKYPVPKKRAAILGMPHGIQDTCLGLPEGMAMDQISNFVAGFHGSLLYYFPRSYDHRFMNAFIKANILIAENEEMVMRGNPFYGFRVRPESPYPAPLYRPYPKYLPELNRLELLQVAGFQQDGKFLAAVGNFWEKGDVVFRLSVASLRKDKDYVVTEKAFSRSFTKQGRKYFKGRDLERGIRLHASALRWAFFEIAPVEHGEMMKHNIDAERMERELHRAEKENLDAAKIEAKQDTLLLQQNTTGDLKTLEDGDFQCAKGSFQGRPVLNLSSGKNRMTVDPCGLQVLSWNAGGSELVQNSFGLSGFWSPGKRGTVLAHNFKITDQLLSEKSCTISGEFMTSSRSYPALPDLKLRKTLKISKDLTKLEIRVRLHNPLPVAMNLVAYRWHFIPSCWNAENGGSLEFPDRKGTDTGVLNRPNGKSLLLNRNGRAYSSALQKIFHVNGKEWIFGSFGNKVIFAGKRKVLAEFMPENMVAGAAIWDTPNMPSPTFEPFYLPQTIPPGESISFQAHFSLE